MVEFLKTPWSAVVVAAACVTAKCFLGLSFVLTSNKILLYKNTVSYREVNPHVGEDLSVLKRLWSNHDRDVVQRTSERQRVVFHAGML